MVEKRVCAWGVRVDSGWWCSVRDEVVENRESSAAIGPGRSQQGNFGGRRILVGLGEMGPGGGGGVQAFFLSGDGALDTGPPGAPLDSTAGLLAPLAGRVPLFSPLSAQCTPSPIRCSSYGARSPPVCDPGQPANGAIWSGLANCLVSRLSFCGERDRVVSGMALLHCGACSAPAGLDLPEKAVCEGQGGKVANRGLPRHT